MAKSKLDIPFGYKEAPKDYLLSSAYKCLDIAI